MSDNVNANYHIKSIHFRWNIGITYKHVFQAFSITKAMIYFHINRKFVFPFTIGIKSSEIGYPKY